MDSLSHRPLRLSVLDQSPIRQGATARQALQETLQLAQLCDRLGYHRFWVSEHHNTAFLAGSSPEVLIAHLAGHTQHIRVGSGGVMLPHYSALKVAENFRLLEALFPGRIDLGMGRAPGADRLTAHVLNPANTFRDEDFAEQLMDLRAYLRDEQVPDTVHMKVQAHPQTDTAPELWLLSSSGQSGLFAAHLGMGFSFAQFINPHGGPAMMQLYRERFQPSAELAVPTANVALFVLCADTDEKARQLQASLDLQLLRIGRADRTGFPTYEEARRYDYSVEELGQLQHNRQRYVCGTPEQVKKQLENLARSYGVDEVVATTITADFADRLRSYELLAEVFAVPAHH
ncbi:LLM class flavin-dependent oxidoreductase [Hymenobacter busanensis]|uniref:Luciferase-like monooxygenase n=1 Tax=Hymenobacter busanensis TaxID=2607656 RepID=A0A7L4ZT29_9BACT|nr:LLM class flavin-dependent oxidoreductase [Hymenobacter busanensis]KAA9327565.1 LLM class flavin-dependent oxidoreductase [Hymenobacter busanensis]QHJ06097.1 MsnO8 family LLM class oxidoreductase [Hymenobacter busanensis]